MFDTIGSAAPCLNDATKSANTLESEWTSICAEETVRYSCSIVVTSSAMSRICSFNRSSWLSAHVRQWRISLARTLSVKPPRCPSQSFSLNPGSALCSSEGTSGGERM